MAIQQLNTIDKDADLIQRVRQSADLMRADANMLNYYGQMRKERRAKEAANTAYQNLAAKSKGKIEFRNDPDNELGSPLIKKEKNFDENVRAGATDYSRDTKTEAMLSVESGDNRYRTHIDSNRQIVEDGSLAPVQEHMKGLMGNIVPGAIAAPPAQSSLAPSYNQAQPSSTVPAGRPPANPSITTGVPPERIAQATQDVFNDMKLGAIPANGGSASRGRNRSVNESYNSGNATPVTMKVQHAQAGFADMNPDAQEHYIDSEAQAIENATREVFGLPKLDNIANLKLDHMVKRYDALNQSLNPNFNADIQGGGFSGPSRSSGRSEGWNVSKGSGGAKPDAQPRREIAGITGQGESPGNVVFDRHDDGTITIKPSDGKTQTQFGKATREAIRRGEFRYNNSKDAIKLSKAAVDAFARWEAAGLIDANGHFPKDYHAKTPGEVEIINAANRAHYETDRQNVNKIGSVTNETEIGKKQTNPAKYE